MKTNHGEEVAPSLVVVDSGWTSVLLIFVALFFSPPDYYFFFFSVCIRKMTKASPRHFTGHYTSLLFHSKRHGKAGWTSFLASNVRNVVKWKVS